MSSLEEGERVEANDGCHAKAPRHVKCPKNANQQADTEQMQAFVRCRQETVNLRFKQFAVMRHVFRHDICDHGECFHAVAVVAQLSVCNDKPLFNVDCQDPCLNDFCHPAPEESDHEGNSSEEE